MKISVKIKFLAIFQLISAQELPRSILTLHLMNENSLMLKY